MNERIRELADEAGIDTTDFENCPIELYGAEQQLNKFAELIVRECADFIKPLGDWRGGHGEPPMPSTSELAKRLKEHFGVEE
jgi:hypothetical protein